jgi:lipopolysaccharide transport system ATP-binding protein
MPDSTILVQDLGKRYRIWTHHPPTTLKERVALSASRLRRRPSNGAPLRSEIWALQNVSFEIPRGEIFGVIGANGAGKSTLLAILAGVTEPTTGYAEIRGRVSSLLEVGTGFHPELSGRDNIFLNGTFLGMSRRETRHKFDEIVEFSELGDLIDMPVKRYSTGMYMRLAFAVSAHMDPEILLLDEVLSVGDAAFQEKSLARIDQITRSGRTVLFVSHDASSVANLCHRVLYLKDGRPQFVGPVDEALERYLGTRPELLHGGGNLEHAPRDGNGECRIRQLTISHGDGSPEIYPHEPVAISAEVAFARNVDPTGTELEVAFTSPITGQLAGIAAPLDEDEARAGASLSVSVDFTIEELPLKPGTYFLSVDVVRGNEVLDRVMNQVEFTIYDSRTTERSQNLPEGSRAARASIVQLRHSWRLASSTAEPDGVGDVDVVRT